MPHIATTRSAAVQEIATRECYHRCYKLRDLRQIAANIAETSSDDDTAALAAMIAFILPVIERNDTLIHQGGGH